MGLGAPFLRRRIRAAGLVALLLEAGPTRGPSPPTPCFNTGFLLQTLGLNLPAGGDPRLPLEQYLLEDRPVPYRGSLVIPVFLLFHRPGLQAPACSALQPAACWPPLLAGGSFLVPAGTVLLPAGHTSGKISWIELQRRPPRIFQLTRSSPCSRAVRSRHVPDPASQTRPQRKRFKGAFNQ